MTRSNGHVKLGRPGAAQRGFSLIEAMVALVVVSVAAVGLAGLQAFTLRNTNNALLESQAATLAQDLIERMRANGAGNYATTLGAAIAIGNIQCEGTAANCNPAAMALYDLTRWKCSLGAAAMADVCAARNIPAQLPNGDGQVVVAGNALTITLRWFDTSTNADRTLVIESVR